MTLIFTESFDGYAGTGLAPAATQTTQSTGTLNSNVWLITGMSDAQPGYGGTVGSGDYGRGLFPASSNTTTGGTYAATVGAGRGLGFQPTGGDFAEGANSHVTLRLANTTGSTWQDITVNFDWIWRNNDGRAETMNFSWSTDGTNFTVITAAQLVTGVASDGTNLFQSSSQALTLTGASVANGGNLYLRWAHTASSGSGGRDEVGIDNVSVNVADSGASNVTIDDVSIVEGDSGTSILTFTVTRSTNEGAFTVDYATAADTASDASDFAAATGSVSFTQGGALTQTVSVTINGDLDIENAEQFFVNLSNVVNTTGTATVTDGQGIGTITNDDFPPTVSISDASIVEGDSGQTFLVFTVTRTDENSEFSVEWATQNGTASMSSDYNGDLGEIFFTQGGALSQTISIAVNGDTLAEADETLTVVLSSINNTVGSTTIADDTGAAVIFNDDVTKIYEIQGAGHSSAMNGQQVTTLGVVTAIDKDGNGYWIQDPNGDGDRNTSDGIYVFTSTPVGPEIVVGNLIRVSATVSEFAPGGAANLTLTELVTVTATTVLATNQTLPTAVIIGDTANGADVTPALHTLGSTTDGFDPVNDGVDFWESLEGMRVTLQDVHTTSAFKSGFGEVVVTPDVGANNSLNSRGGLTISDDSPNGTLPADKSFDFNPERIQLDDEALGGSIGNITSVGQTVVGGDVTGIVSYGQGFYDVNVTHTVTFNASTLVKETTVIEENLDRLTVATFNVRNLAPLGFNGGDGVTTQTTLDNLALAIGTNLK
ncbi:MAG: hypothetical protein K0R83_271, partial [Caulobacter sp.]|nr:hypothetical protein [Caulobacter sp.]